MPGTPQDFRAGGAPSLASPINACALFSVYAFAMKIISSRSNAQFKMLHDIIDSPRARREHGMTWIEGERLCRAYLSSEAQEAIAVIAQPAATQAAAWLKPHETRMRETWLLDAKLFAAISPLETSLGWGLLIPIPISAMPLANNTKVFPPGTADAVVVADRIQDPGNLGTVLRSAAAAGVTCAFCLNGTTDPWSPKAMRSAMGAQFGMQIEAAVSQERLQEECQARGLTLLAAARTEKAISLYSPGLDLCKPVAWIFGNEANGISASLLAKAQLVAIPQTQAVESLNVAAAASICLFEMRRQRLS